MPKLSAESGWMIRSALSSTNFYAMTLLRRSEPPVERFHVETSSDTERFEAARKVLEEVGTKRRKKHRIIWALIRGGVYGFTVLWLLYLIRYWGTRSPEWIRYAPPLLQCLVIFAPSKLSASKIQKDALHALVDQAEKQDLPWLIEGTEYADTPELRLSLLQKIKELLSSLKPEDGVYLPEGARRILRGWVWGMFHPEPETALLVLQVLLRIEDAKMRKDCPRLTRRKLHFPGDELIQQLAARATHGEVKAPLAIVNDLSEALAVIAERRKNNWWGNIRYILLGSLTAISLCAGFIQSAQTDSALWMLPGAILLLLALCFWGACLITREANCYTYRQALLVLASQGYTAEHRKLLQDGLVTIGSGKNLRALEEAMERLSTDSVR